MSGRPGMIALTMDDLRRQGEQGLLGAQMTSVVTEGTRPDGKKTYKRYRLPTEVELVAGHAEIESIEEAFTEIPFGIPEEPIPLGGGSGASARFRFRYTESIDGVNCSRVANSSHWQPSLHTPCRCSADKETKP